MMVSQKEITEALRGPIGAVGNAKRKELANRIEAEGIAPKLYVPMTDDDWCEAIDGETRLFHGANIGFCKIVERIVIKRAGLEIKHD